jgi:hypothetical protein
MWHQIAPGSRESKVACARMKFFALFDSGDGHVSKMLRFDYLKLPAAVGELLLNRIAPENFSGRMAA